MNQVRLDTNFIDYAIIATYFAEASGWSAARTGVAPASGSFMATA